MDSELKPCERLPSVPSWWWDYGMQNEIQRIKREAQALDEFISPSSEEVKIGG